MDKNDEEVRKEFEKLINDMEKYSVKDGTKINDEYRKERDEKPMDADSYDLGYEDGYQDGKEDALAEMVDKIDGVTEEDYIRGFGFDKDAEFVDESDAGDIGKGDVGDEERNGKDDGRHVMDAGGRGGDGGRGIGGRWNSFAESNPNSSQWLRTVAASLVATTLGILITFGTKSCETDMEARRANRQLMIDMMYSLDSNIRQFEKDAKAMKEKDSIMQKMYVDYMNAEAARISGSKAEKDTRTDSVIAKESETFINSIMKYNMTPYDVSTEQRFISSENIVKIMKDRKLRMFLNTIYYNEIKSINSLEQINKQTEELLVYVMNDKRKFEVESATEYAQLIMGEEIVLNYIVNHHLAYMKVYLCLDLMRQFYKQLREMTGIKDDELNEKSMVDSIKINSAYHDSMSIG